MICGGMPGASAFTLRAAEGLTLGTFTFTSKTTPTIMSWRVR